jgi:aminopeptidase N
VDLRQQRFLFDPSASVEGSIWTLPVCLKGDWQSTCTLLERKEQTLTVNGCPNTFFANPSARGYYITAYDPALLKRIASSASVALNAAERAVLVDDAWSLVRRGRYQIGDFLDIVDQAREGLASGEWDVPSFRLQYIADNLVVETTAERFAQRIRQLVRPAFDKLGWDAGAKDSMERRAARTAIISILGRAGRDPEVLDEARRRVDRYLSGKLDTDPMMLDTIVGVAASAGDRALHDRLLATGTSQESSPVEARRALSALSQFRDPDLVRRTLEFALSPAARTQDVPMLLGGALRNPASRELAWQFVKDRWSDVNPRTEGPFGSIVIATANFCDARLREDVARFFAEHPLAGSDRPLREALETMDGCIGIREQQWPHLATWLQ